MDIELKQFVSQTLVQVMEGIKEAQTHAAEMGAKINPNNMVMQSDGNYEYSDSGWGGSAQVGQAMEFDIALTVGKSDKASAGIAVFAAALSVGGKGDVEEYGNRVSRIRFSVPVFFPEQEE